MQKFPGFWATLINEIFESIELLLTPFRYIPQMVHIIPPNKTFQNRFIVVRK